MMKIGKSRWLSLGALAAVLGSLVALLMLPALEKDVEGFAVVKINGKAAYFKDGKEYKPLREGTAYPYGTLIKTGRGTTVDIAFSPENVCRLMPRTRLAIVMDIKNPKLKRLKLEKGKVAIKLDNWPKGHQLRVETPTAVCGALGTRFSISFEDDTDDSKKATREMTASCERGTIYARSRFTINSITTEGKTFDAPKIGQGTEFVAKVHEGLQNAYTDVEVRRGALRIQYGVKDGAAIEARAEEKKPSRFVCALAKADEPAAGMVVSVKRGSVFEHRRSGFIFKSDRFTPIPETTAEKPVLIAEGKILDPGEKAPLAKAYLDTARAESERYSQLVTAGEDPTQDEKLKKLSEQATELRNQLFSTRVLRMMRHIRSGARRGTQGIPRR